jgi:hypothetical protein
MKILEIDPKNRRQRKQFLDLPFRLYRDVPQWVPPLDMDIQHVFSQRHPFYRHGEAAFYIAQDHQGQVLGRIVVLKNRLYNEFNHDQAAFYYLFECIQDYEVSQALFEQASVWAKSKALTRLIGPKGFTVMDGLGMLVKGFEHRPAFGLPYNLPYYPELVEAAGFTSADELVSGYVNIGRFNIPEKVRKISELVQAKRGLKVIRFKNRFQFNKMIPLLHELYNASLTGTTGNVPLTIEDIRTMVNQLFWFANPRLIKIIVKDNSPVGFLLAYPDISAAVQRCHGRILPLGWLDLILESRRTRWVNINGAGIIEKFRGQGGTALLFNEMEESIRSGKYLHADLVQIGTDNDKMQLELRSLGIDFYKVHRTYQKILS